MTHDHLTDVSLCTATFNASDIYLDACSPTDPSELTPLITSSKPSMCHFRSHAFSAQINSTMN